MNPLNTRTEQGAGAPVSTRTVSDLNLGLNLFERGLLTKDDLTAATRQSAQTGEDLSRTLVRMNLLSAEQIAGVLRDLEGTDNGFGGARPAAPTQSVRPHAVEMNRTQRERDIRAELAEIAETATPPDLVTQIFERAFESRATDIHFDPQEDAIRVRYRIDGQLHDALMVDAQLGAAVFSRIKILANMNIVERRAAQDGHISMARGDRRRDVRIATVPTSLGEKLVVRVMDETAVSHGLDQLGLEPPQVEAVTRLVDQPYGAMLVAGPVGSGKTTTLYSCLNRVNVPERNVMTIEDPVEYRLLGVNQLQVDNRFDFTFAKGLRAMLRQDPDSIMIGEIRDDETANIGIRAALTGVMVFSSIHASDASAVIGTLYNYGIPGFLISSSLLGIISQRLMRKICPYCKVSYRVDETILNTLGLDPAEYANVDLFRGTGCTSCFETGYLGRTGVYEVMEIQNAEELRDLIFRQTPKEVLRQVAIDLGMQTLKQSALNKVLDGTTTVEEMYRVVAM